MVINRNVSTMSHFKAQPRSSSEHAIELSPESFKEERTGCQLLLRPYQCCCSSEILTWCTSYDTYLQDGGDLQQWMTSETYTLVTHTDDIRNIHTGFKPASRRLLFSKMNQRQENRSKLSFTARIITKYSLERFFSICGEKMSKGFLKFYRLIIKPDTRSLSVR